MFETVVRGMKRPDKALVHARRQIGRIENRLRGCDVMAEDWDTLILLDACRFDMFEELNYLPGRLESRRSKGSATKEFVRNNFAGRTFDDTVYVSANPYVSELAADSFHELVEVWKTKWDDELGTVPPSVMADAAISAFETFPNKRLIVHFMQPHHPFLGDTAQRTLRGVAGNEHARDEVVEGTASSDPVHVWDRIDEFDVETVRAAYYETLEETLPHVESVADAMTGLTVITSDHGNLLGERAYPYLPIVSPRFAHPIHATAEALVKVPWLVCPYEARRSITSEPARERTDRANDQRAIDERLRSLGYK